MESDGVSIARGCSSVFLHNVAASQQYVVLDTLLCFPRPLLASSVRDLDEHGIVESLRREERRVFFRHVVVLCEEREEEHMITAVQSYAASHSCVSHGLVRRVTLVFLRDSTSWPPCLLQERNDMDVDTQLFKLDRTVLPHKITKNIYLGDWLSATDLNVLQSLDVVGVVNASNHFPNKFADELRYLSVDVDDYPTESLVEHFSRAQEFRAKLDGPILIHCAQGVSRSASLVIALLMHEGLTLDQATTFVHSRRDVISPNQGFLEQLSQLEAELRGSGSRSFVRMDELLSYNHDSLVWENGLVTQIKTTDGKTISLD